MLLIPLRPAVLLGCKPGGTISGRIVLNHGRRLPDAVVATDARGCSIQAPDFQGVVREGYTISGLWPGKWTVRVKSGDKVLAAAEATVEGRETVDRDLVGK